MTVHKLSAGLDGGYSYLTRQVASADQRRARGALADYYAARGNPPGVWPPRDRPAWLRQEISPRSDGTTDWLSRDR